MRTQRLRLTVAYTGSAFHGWQLQPESRTVQGVLEDIFSRLVGRAVRVHGSSRTDAGVHALAQVAHVDLPENKASIHWQRAVNSLCPADVTLVEARPVEDTFHARFSATAKEYVYTLWREPGYVLPQRRPFVWPVRGVDMDALRLAAAGLPGRRDFACFQNTGTPVSSTVRMLYSVDVEEDGALPETRIVFRAEGFLKQMARNMTGLLVEVGRGCIDPGDIPGMFAARERSRCPATAPARGLCLTKVWYGEEFCDSRSANRT